MDIKRNVIQMYVVNPNPRLLFFLATDHTFNEPIIIWADRWSQLRARDIFSENGKKKKENYIDA